MDKIEITRGGVTQTVPLHDDSVVVLMTDRGDGSYDSAVVYEYPAPKIGA